LTIKAALCYNQRKLPWVRPFVPGDILKVIVSSIIVKGMLAGNLTGVLQK